MSLKRAAGSSLLSLALFSFAAAAVRAEGAPASCIPNGGSCGIDGRPCCSDFCSGGVCKPAGSVPEAAAAQDDCLKDGLACSESAQCCTKWCHNGTCEPWEAFPPVSAQGLLPDGELCRSNAQCRGGLCKDGACASKPKACAPGALSAKEDCLPNGADCSSRDQCCSDFCLSGKCRRPPVPPAPGRP